jgi:hypothetical protein
MAMAKNNSGATNAVVHHGTGTPAGQHVTPQRKLDRLKRSSWFEVIRLFEKQLLTSCSSAAATVGRHGQTHQPDSAAI